MKKINFFRCIAITFLTISCTNHQSEELVRKELEVKQLTTENDSIKKELFLLTEKIKTEHSAIYWLSVNHQEYEKYGIKNLEEFLDVEVRKMTEIIPLKAVLGGTMNFENIKILSEKWLITDYSDGHIYGKSLFEYHIDQNKNLSLKLIASQSY
jgi:hypothetical protein